MRRGGVLLGVDPARLLGEARSDVLGIRLNLCAHAEHQGVHLFLGARGLRRRRRGYARRHHRFGDIGVGALRASDVAARGLLVVGGAVAEPALELMAAPADEAVLDHCEPPRGLAAGVDDIECPIMPQGRHACPDILNCPNSTSAKMTEG